MEKFWENCFILHLSLSSLEMYFSKKRLFLDISVLVFTTCLFLWWVQVSVLFFGKVLSMIVPHRSSVHVFRVWMNLFYVVAVQPKHELWVTYFIFTCWCASKTLTLSSFLAFRERGLCQTLMENHLQQYFYNFLLFICLKLIYELCFVICEHLTIESEQEESGFKYLSALSKICFI